MKKATRIVIGSRGSALARAQTAIVVERLQKRSPELALEVRYIATSGDKDQTSQLSAIGGKGVFIREIEQALLAGEIDMAVHSFKDVTSSCAPECSLAAFLEPESVGDVLITRNGETLESLPESASIGTGSMRRKALLSCVRADLQTVPIRGNVETRIAKVDRGEVDGIILSEAGLIRLGLTHRISYRFDPANFYPAPGQGVITLETRSDDSVAHQIARIAGDEAQYQVSVAELALLTTIGFDCRTPLGLYTIRTDATLQMRGFFVSPSSAVFRFEEIAGSIDTAEELGICLAQKLLQEQTN